MNMAASPDKAVTLLSHTTVSLGRPYIVLYYGTAVLYYCTAENNSKLHSQTAVPITFYCCNTSKDISNCQRHCQVCWDQICYSTYVVVLTLTRSTIKSVVTGQAPATLELRNTPGKNTNNPRWYTYITADAIHASARNI